MSIQDRDEFYNHNDHHLFRRSYSGPGGLLSDSLLEVSKSAAIRDIYRDYSPSSLKFSLDDVSDVLEVSLVTGPKSDEIYTSLYIEKDTYNYSRGYHQRKKPAITYSCSCIPEEGETCVHGRALMAIYASILYPSQAPEVFRWCEWINEDEENNQEWTPHNAEIRLTKSKQEFSIRGTFHYSHYYGQDESRTALERLLQNRTELKGPQGAAILNYLACQNIDILFRSQFLQPDINKAVAVTFIWVEKSDELILKKKLPKKCDIITTDPPYYVDLTGNSYGIAELQPGVLQALNKTKNIGPIPRNQAREFSIALAKTGISIPLPDTSIQLIERKIKPNIIVDFARAGQGKKTKPRISVTMNYGDFNPADNKKNITQTSDNIVTRFVEDRDFLHQVERALSPANLHPTYDFGKTIEQTEITAANASILKNKLEKLAPSSGGHLKLNTSKDYPVVLYEYHGDLSIDAELDAGTNLINFTPGLVLNGHRVNLLKPILGLLNNLEEDMHFDEFIAALPAKVILDIDAVTAIEIPVSVLKPLLNFAHDYAINRNELRITRFDAPALFDLQTALKDNIQNFYLQPKIKESRAFFDALQQGTLPRASLPEEFIGPLDDYQKKGIDWLCFLAQFGFGGILADDMGLGKTRQVIGYISIRRRLLSEETRPNFLVICPVNPIQDWFREIEECCPTIVAYEHHGTSRHKDFASLKKYEVVVTTYATFVNDTFLREGVVWDTVILDEIQDANNDQTGAFKAISELRANMFIGSSGTPMENTLEEFRAVMDLVNTGFLGNRSQFNRLYTKPIVDDGCIDTLRNLRKKIGLFVLRRKEGDEGVHLSTPKNTIEDIEFELNGAHLDQYEKVRIAGHADVLRKLKESGVLKGSINTLPSLIEMRRICCDLQLAKEYNGEQYSNLKLNYLVNELQSLSKANKKALVFTYFSESMRVMSGELEKLGVNHLCIDGSDGKTARNKKKDHFREGKSDHILATLGCMNSGANLQSAHEVFIYDPWYNPYKEIQAIKRAHRRGLEHELRTRRLLFKNTIETGVVKIRERKKALFDAVMEADINYLVSGGITQEDLDIIFRSPTR